MKFQKSGLLIAAVLGVVLTTLFLLSYYPVGFAREEKRASKSAPPAVRENDKVSYEVERGKKGLNAVRVKLAR